MAAVVVVVALFVLWYLLRGLAGFWAPAADAVGLLSPWTVRLRAWVLSAPATFTYIVLFTAGTFVQKTAPPKLIDLLTRVDSTNLWRLSDDPATVLVTSALWVADEGSGLALYAAVFGTVVAWAERRYGTPRLMLIAISAHVLGSLCTARVERWAIDSGRAPHTLVLATDVGVSYMMVGSCAAAVLVMRGPVRWAGVAALVVTVAVPVFVSRTIWDLGHLLATAFGLATAALALLAAPPRKPPPLTEPWAAAVAVGGKAVGESAVR
ncbi:rhomboid-like protein [Yinghuangia sp. YIM S09857]|uniref:rhomboid-like protein n=1 Tax=Yinghuangia sp. YIM S09857 TaxID=3436929 RepID=UPI003F52D55E